jgi:hypothetical protein|tara:strand:- start:1030 stop:1470 length:441 start_codon:yes stop_codon:yes gene_type:complete
LNVVKRDIGGWPPGLKIPIGRKSMTKTLTLTSDQLELIVKAAVEAALQSVAPEPKAPVKKKASKKKDPLAPKKTAKPSAPKVDRAARKAQNKVLWRQINGKILKAENAKTEVLALGFLKEATKMTPAAWTSVHNKIVAKHEVLIAA